MLLIKWVLDIEVMSWLPKSSRRFYVSCKTKSGATFVLMKNWASNHFWAQWKIAKESYTNSNSEGLKSALHPGLSQREVPRIQQKEQKQHVKNIERKCSNAAKVFPGCHKSKPILIQNKNYKKQFMRVTTHYEFCIVKSALPVFRAVPGLISLANPSIFATVDRRLISPTTSPFPNHSSIWN